MPKCKTCSNYWHKDWSVNFECRLGNDTPDFGDTDACSSYEEQYTFGEERESSHDEDRSEERSDRSDKDNSGSSSHEGNYGGGGGGSGGGGGGGGSPGCAIAFLIFIGIVVAVILFNIFSGPTEEQLKRREESAQRETERIELQRKQEADIQDKREKLDRRRNNAVVSFTSGAITIRPRSAINFGERIEMTIRLKKIENYVMNIEVCNNGPVMYNAENRTYTIGMHHDPTRYYSWEFKVPDISPGGCITIDGHDTNTQSSKSLEPKFFEVEYHACEMDLRQGYVDSYGKFNASFDYPIIK